MTSTDPLSVAREPADPARPPPSWLTRPGHGLPSPAHTDLLPGATPPPALRAPPTSPRPAVEAAPSGAGGRTAGPDHSSSRRPRCPSGLRPVGMSGERRDQVSSCSEAPDGCCRGTPRGAGPETRERREEVAGGRASHRPRVCRGVCSRGPTGGTSGPRAAPEASPGGLVVSARGLAPRGKPVPSAPRLQCPHAVQAPLGSQSSSSRGQRGEEGCRRCRTRDRTPRGHLPSRAPGPSGTSPPVDTV